jgi:hypothetical protein
MATDVRTHRFAPHGREDGSRARARYLPIAEHGVIGDLHTIALGVGLGALPRPGSATRWGGAVGGTTLGVGDTPHLARRRRHCSSPLRGLTFGSRPRIGCAVLGPPSSPWRSAARSPSEFRHRRQVIRLLSPSAGPAKQYPILRSQSPRRANAHREWARLISNQRPLACEAASPGRSETASASRMRRFIAGRFCAADCRGLRDRRGFGQGS